MKKVLTAITFCAIISTAMKIILSKDLKQYIRNFESIDEAAKKIGVSEPTLYALLSDSRTPSNEFIAKVQESVGWDFERAFEVVE